MRDYAEVIIELHHATKDLHNATLKKEWQKAHVLAANCQLITAELAEILKEMKELHDHYL